jgi:glutamate synthase domain-containing protein 1
MANEFIEKASASLKEAAKTMHERGGQYADTWGKDGCWHLTKAVVKKFTDKEIDAEACKAIALAAFVDQKYSRFAGGYKHDTALDIIPYLGALAEQIKQQDLPTAEEK